MSTAPSELAQTLRDARAEALDTTVSGVTWQKNVSKGAYLPADGSDTRWGRALARIDSVIAALLEPPPSLLPSESLVPSPALLPSD